MKENRPTWEIILAIHTAVSVIVGLLAGIFIGIELHKLWLLV